MPKSDVEPIIQENEYEGNILFTKCCCCIPLRVGCFIIGYISLITNLLYTLNLTCYIALDSMDAQTEDNSLQFLKTFKNTSTLDLKEEGFDLQDGNTGVMLLMVLGFNVLWLIVNVAAIVGLHMRKPGPIRFFVIFAVTRLLFTALSYLYIMRNQKEQLYPGNIANILTHVIDYVLGIHFILVYCFYARQLANAIENDKVDVSKNIFSQMTPEELDSNPKKTGAFVIAQFV